MMRIFLTSFTNTTEIFLPRRANLIVTMVNNCLISNYSLILLISSMVQTIIMIIRISESVSRLGAEPGGLSGVGSTIYCGIGKCEKFVRLVLFFREFSR